MKRYLTSRLASSMLLLWMVVTLTFLAIHLSPGDPASTLVDGRVSQAQIAQIRSHYGFDKSLLTQYGIWLKNCVQGDLGQSFIYRRATSTVLLSHLSATILLGGFATFLALFLGLSLGTLTALRRGSKLDTSTRIAALVLYAAPPFWLGLMVLLLFSGTLRWFPASGMLSPLAPTGASPWQPSQWLSLLHHIALPTLVLATPLTVQIFRIVRSGLEQQMALDYITAGRSLGFSEPRLAALALRNCLGPVVQILGTWMPVLVGGAVMVEQVFSWPGLGSVAVAAISGRDYPLVLAITMLTASAVILANFLADIGHGLIDPRVRNQVTLGSQSAAGDTG